MRVDFLADFFGTGAQFCGGVASRAVRVQGVLIDVLMVHHQQAIVAAVVDRMEPHAVVMHANRVGLIFGGVGAVGLPGVGGAVERGSPRGQHLRAIAAGNGYSVGFGAGDRFKTKLEFGRAGVAATTTGNRRVIVTRATGAQTNTGQHRRHRNANATVHHAPAADGFLKNGRERLVTAFVVFFWIEGCLAHLIAPCFAVLGWPQG